MPGVPFVALVSRFVAGLEVFALAAPASRLPTAASGHGEGSMNLPPECCCQERRAIRSISTSASRANPVTPMQVLAGLRSLLKYPA